MVCRILDFCRNKACMVAVLGFLTSSAIFFKVCGMSRNVFFFYIYFAFSLRSRVTLFQFRDPSFLVFQRPAAEAAPTFELRGETLMDFFCSRRITTIRGHPLEDPVALLLACEPLCLLLAQSA